MGGNFRNLQDLLFNPLLFNDCNRSAVVTWRSGEKRPLLAENGPLPQGPSARSTALPIPKFSTSRVPRDVHVFNQQGEPNSRYPRISLINIRLRKINAL